MREFDQESFDDFYAHWIELTKRKNSMGEYGQLVFLIGKANTWNKRTYRFILQEKKPF